jgi:NTP pyrophosphatase (non-canonical NTP hydrolase)
MGTYHLEMASTDELIEEIQKRGLTVVPGGQERKKGEIVVRSDDESSHRSGLSISEWRAEILAWARSKGWDDEAPNVGERLMLVVTELAEAMEDYRNGLDLTEMTFEGPNRKPCGFPSEIADAVIRLIHICGRFEIDLEGAMIVKHAYNETRPAKHGGKLC